ncbi:MAG: exodeoxyribonuclease III [Pseudarcicella sp.]|nr:exodeoxyribonuclease III [Pseudarcicella sp.]MBP6409719.1 exodeoxyribonuclease III [Pseudarcicella sp.]
MSLKIVSYNVNGIRAAINKGFTEWLQATNADIVCLQEVKANIEQIDPIAIHALGYEIYWFAAQKKGYSGVAIFTKIQPKHVVYGCGIDIYDDEGRVLRADFDNFSVMSVYMPSGSSGDERQTFKYQWMDDFQDYVSKLLITIPNLIISGDYNICHEAIDIHNPKSNANSSGFLPEEREWMGKFLDNGMIDSFRHLNKEPHHYSWWSYRAGARNKNLGWRIDYHCVSKPLKDKILRAYILPEAKHSDHCPIVVEIEN